MKKLIKVLLIVLWFSGCNNLLDTDTGNPITPGEPQQGQDCGGFNNTRCMPTSAVSIQVGTICRYLNKCADIPIETQNDVQACTDNVSNQSGLAEKIKLPFINFGELNAAYNSKKLITNSILWNTCLHSIENLSCDSAVSQNSFNKNFPEGFSRIHNLLDADISCLQIYKLKDNR